MKWTLENRNKLYHKAAIKFGLANQIASANEELAELIVELSKMLNGKRRKENPLDIEKLVDELVDGSIMIEQMILNFDVSDEVLKRRSVKLDRLEKML